MRINKQRGFTVIEVMIVLAVAGLSILIVFMAVPALRRNNRNAQRKTDVANYLAAAQDVINNNNGRSPDTCWKLNAGVCFVKNVKWLTYNGSSDDVGWIHEDENNQVYVGLRNHDKFHYLVGSAGFKCDGSNAVDAQGKQSVAVVYYLEASTTPGIKQCSSI